MDPAALAGLCALLAAGQGATPLPPGLTCQTPAPVASPSAPPVLDGRDLASKLSDPAARDAVARVAYAEAPNQGDSGLAAVVYTILNRLADGRWGATVEAVVNARAQFEPVMRVGGDWRRLPAVTAAESARIETILNLALEGRLPDLTQGARYFQNPAIVASRARNGQVAPSLVHFGGQAPSAVIGDHSFYVGQESAGVRPARAPGVLPATAPASLFVGPNRSGEGPSTQTEDASEPSTPADGGRPQVGDPGRGMFVTRDGFASAGQP